MNSEQLRRGLAQEIKSTYEIAPKRESEMVKAVADALDRERRQRESLSDEVKSLRRENATLVERLDRLERSLYGRHTGGSL